MKEQSVGKALLRSLGFVVLYEAFQYGIPFLAMIFFEIRYGLSYPPAVAAEYAQRAFLSNANEIGALIYLSFFGAVIFLLRGTVFGETGMKKTSPLSVCTGAVGGFGAYGATLVLLSVILAAFPAVTESQGQYVENYQLSQQYSVFWLEVVITGIVGPFAEEFLFRGLVQKSLSRAMAPWLAILVASTGFALMHGNLYQMVYTLPLGIVMGLLAWRMDSLWPAVALHMVYNLSNFLPDIPGGLGYSADSDFYLMFTGGAIILSLVCVPVTAVLFAVAARRTPAPEPLFGTRSAPKATPFSGQTPPYGAQGGVPYSGQMPPYGAQGGVPYSGQTPVDPPFPPPMGDAEIPTQEGTTMAAPEFILVGLGNPGPRYQETRHNCGFLLLEEIARRGQIRMNQLRFRALTGEGMLGGKKVLLMEPQTFMNLSGQAVAEAARFYKIPPENILVIYDDVNFVPGAFRIRKTGSAGGHNGIKSIIECLGTEAFPRIKMGVGNPPEGWDLMNWVLGKFSPDETEKIALTHDDVWETVFFFLREGDAGLEKAMQRFQGKTRG